MAYMEATCEELRRLSNNQLDKAMEQIATTRPSTKKRTWETIVDSDSANQSKRAVPAPAYTSPPANKLNDELFPTYDNDVNGTTHYVDPGSNQNLFSETLDSSLAAVQSFDAPLMHIMNGVPLFMNSIGEGPDQNQGNAGLCQFP